VYISQLLIDTGTDPDRERPGRRWLTNPYHVHQRLWMAFPSAGRRSRDPEFLQPYRGADFREHAQVDRTAVERFLYRVEVRAFGRAVILVQSAARPDFAYAFGNAPGLLGAPAETKPYDPRPPAGEHLRFRLRANPTYKRDGRGDDKRRAYHREEDQLAWLHRKAEAGGFAVEGVRVVPEGMVTARRPGKRRADPDGKLEDWKPIEIYSVLFEGTLRVTDAEAFRRTLETGIGSAKGFGFGLLSVARLE
jgi:CRISPR system Cascade subunit CasE